MIFTHLVKRYRASYFANRVIAVLATAIIILSLSACESNPVPTGMGTIAGTAELSDPDPGTGHAGILVYLAGTQHQARTDQQGRYRIDGIPAGTYDLIAEKASYQGQVIEGLLVSPDAHNSATPLQPSATLLTRLSGAGGAQSGSELGSIEGVVLLESMPEDNGGVRVELDGTAFVTVSSTDGRYRILNVPPGSYRLSFYRDGFKPYKMPNEVQVTTGVTVMQEVALELLRPGDPVPAASVAEAAAARAAAPAQAEPPPGPDVARTIVGLVEVRDEAGKVSTDYSDVTIAINGTSMVADIDSLGQFRFDDLTSGTYTLVGTVEGGPVVQIPVDLETQRLATISVRLLKGDAAGGAGGTVRGKIVLLDMESQPLEDASGVRVAINGTESMATTGADGVFVLTSVPSGNYTISASKENFITETVGNINVTAAAPVDIGLVELQMDVERPRVIASSPENNAREVEVGYNLPISFKFDHPMDAGSLRNAISLTPRTPFNIVPGPTADSLTINLSNDSAESPIIFGANYRVTISDSAANLDGVTMAEPYVLAFQTAKPGVMATSPESGARDVYVDQLQNPVLFWFNTRLDPGTINDRNIRVRPSTGVSVSTTYTNADENGWTTLRVATQWQPDTNYTVTISRRVRSASGQPLGNTPYTLKFRTAPMEVMTMPILRTR